MAEKIKIPIATVNSMASAVADQIRKAGFAEPVAVYAVPRGGIPAALAVGRHIDIILTEHINAAQVIIDDLIDSGATMSRDEFFGKQFFALIDKRDWAHDDSWVVWPWEDGAEGGIEDNIRRLIQFTGDDATREGLQETPARVAKAWSHWFGGYDVDIGSLFKTFEDGAEGCDEMVAVVDIPFYSKCEHHLADIFGTATIAYIPSGKVVGLSKLSRVLDAYARRMQVQERLTGNVADALMKYLEPVGAGVVIKARHMCMESRGVQQQGHYTVTTALRGVFKTEPETRAEFLRLAGR